MEEAKKPQVLTKGWGLMKRYIDANLDVYEQTKFIGTTQELRDKGEEIEDKPTAKVQEEKKEKEKDVLQQTLEQNAQLVESTNKLIELLSKQNSGATNTTDIAKVLLEYQAQLSGQPLKYGAASIDPADILPKGDEVVYYAPGIMYLIVDYYNEAGVAIRSPYNKIFLFNHQGGKITKTAKEESYNAFCSITVRSKKDVEWIEKHPMYGKMFFRKTNKALNTNISLALKTSEIYQSVNNWDRDRILEEATKRGIEFNFAEGIDSLIKEIAFQKATEIAKEEMEKAVETHRKNNLEGLFIANQ